MNEKVQKCTGHMKELFIVKGGELNKQMWAHAQHCNQVYFQTFYHNPLYFVRINDDAKDYSK